MGSAAERSFSDMRVLRTILTQMLLIEACFHDICVCDEKQNAGEKHTGKETAQDASNDIVEVKNHSGRPQQYSLGS